jgi:opacity protein-like surface antigen
MKIVFVKVLLELVLISSMTFCQDNFVSNVSKKGTSAAAFLSISQGARATGMGSAFVGVADDQSAFYWNPAGLSKLQGVGILIDHTNWLADIAYNFLAASYNLGDLGTVGFSFTSSDYGDMKVTTVDAPEGTGQTFTVSDVAFSIGYARKLTDNFSIGFNPKIIYQSIWQTSAVGFAMDLGVLYTTPFDGIILGMSISNFGTKMQLQGNSTLVTYDPDPTTVGNNGKIPANLSTDYWSLPLNFRVGLAYSPIATEKNKITLAVDAVHPSDNYESVNVGAEYVYNDLIAIRGGYKSLFLQNSEESFTLGFGVKQILLGNIAIKVDYAYQDFGRLTNIQKFSLNISF